MADNELSYRLVRSKRKTLGITIERDGEIVLRAPNDCSQEAIDYFFEKKKQWIYRKLGEKKDVEDDLPPKEYVNGEGFMYLGRSYRLQLVDDGPALRLSHGYFKLNRKYLDNAREVFIDWYKRHALPIIEKRMTIYKNMLGVEPGKVKIFDLQYRWGSCTPEGNLNIHWKTILAPMPVVDYVVAHELVHFKEINHTKQFWDTLESILPGYEKHKEWLRVNGKYLKV